MSGRKGRSGRKSHYDEMAIAEVVNLSVKTVRDYLRDERMPLSKRAQLGQAFVVKAMPQKVDAEVLAEVMMMPMIDKDGKPLEYKVGT